MNQFFNIYQYIAPLILTPLSFWLWWHFYEGNLYLILIAWLIPILFAYIVPGVGTNILKVWEFNTKYRLGKFRAHHGFVFGSTTSMIAWLCHINIVTTIFEIVQLAFILSCTIGFLNLIYDIKAIKANILIVYNQPWAEGKSEAEIAMDYAPIFFAGFGAIYGFSIGIAELLFFNKTISITLFLWYFTLTLVVAILVPVVLYRHRSFKIHGHSGCKPIKKIYHKT